MENNLNPSGSSKNNNLPKSQSNDLSTPPSQLRRPALTFPAAGAPDISMLYI